MRDETPFSQNRSGEGNVPLAKGVGHATVTGSVALTHGMRAGLAAGPGRAFMTSLGLNAHWEARTHLQVGISSAHVASPTSPTRRSCW